MKRIMENKGVRIVLMVIKAISTLIICGVVSIIFVQRISNNKLTVGGYSIFTIVSESMVPKYQIGDMLIARKIDPADIKVGDAVVYIGEKGDFKDKVVTHEVIRKTPTREGFVFTTKGLANMVEDPTITEDQIYGVVVHKTFILSTLSKVVNNTYGFYFVIFLPFTIMIFLEILEVINEKDQEEEVGSDGRRKEKE